MPGRTMCTHQALADLAEAVPVVWGVLADLVVAKAILGED